MNLQPFAIACSGSDFVFCKYESSTYHSVAKLSCTFKVEISTVLLSLSFAWRSGVLRHLALFVNGRTTFLRTFFNSVLCNTGATPSLRPFIDVDLKLYEKHIHTWSTRVDCSWLSKVSNRLGQSCVLFAFLVALFTSFPSALSALLRADIFRMGELATTAAHFGCSAWCLTVSFAFPSMVEVETIIGKRVFSSYWLCLI